jgi:AcrR family transcriptional regulator
VARTQQERKAETRDRLLAAAAELFARKGFHGVSAEAVADGADRTTGALYAHFGGKEGLLLELLNGWRAEIVDAVESELDHMPGIDDRLEALWRRFAATEADEAARERAEAMVLLEHELWLYAARNQEVAATLADRQRDNRSQLGRGIEHFAAAAGTRLARPVHDEATLAYGLLLGLAMQHRMDPASVPAELAVEGLRRLLGLDHDAPGAPPARARDSRGEAPKNTARPNKAGDPNRAPVPVPGPPANPDRAGNAR